MSYPQLLNVYRRSDIVIERGEGCYLFSADGRRYLDFSGGIGVTGLGHAHPHLIAAIKEQAEKVWLTGNMVAHPQLLNLAERLTQQSFADQVFFTSSGQEAVETGLKIMRRFHFAKGAPELTNIITFTGGYHGRSMTCLSAGSSTRAKEGFTPLTPGFESIPFNDLAAAKAAITPQTAGFMLEPVQGEGGVHVADADFLRGLRELCDTHGLLLMLDEVQCGTGRTGRLFAHEFYGITPDICTIAKGIGGGFPLGACLVTKVAGACMTPGSHGSTYGGNALACAVGNAVLDVLLAPGFFEHATAMAERFRTQLESLRQQYPNRLTDIRGRGLMIGLGITGGDHYALADALREAGLFTAPCAGGPVIRLMPPLNLEMAHIEEAISILRATLALK